MWPSRRLVLGIVTVALVGVVAAVLGGRDDSDDATPAPASEEAVRVEHLRATGTHGLGRTTARDFGFDENAIVRLGTGDDAPLVAASRTDDRAVLATWSDDDGRTWLPVRLPDGAVGAPASASVVVIDDLVVVTSPAPSGSLPDATTFLWAGTDLGSPLEPAELEISAPIDPSSRIRVTAAPDARVDGGYVLFGLADDAPVRLGSDDGSRWVVEPMTVSGGGFPPAPDPGLAIPAQEVVVGDRVLVTAGAMTDPLVSTDGGRSWTTAELPGRDPIDGLGPIRAVDGHLYLATWQHAWRSDDDGRSWTTLVDGPLDGARFGLGTGLVVLAADGDRLAGRIGTQDGETSYRADLGWSLDGGRTWQASTGVPPCPAIESEVRGGVTETAALGDGSLLVTWWCHDQMRVLRTTDLGRTWATVPGSVTAGRWSAPIATADGAVVVIGTAGEDQPSAPILHLTSAP